MSLNLEKDDTWGEVRYDRSFKHWITVYNKDTSLSAESHHSEEIRLDYFMRSLAPWLSTFPKTRQKSFLKWAS